MPTTPMPTFARRTSTASVLVLCSLGAMAQLSPSIEVAPSILPPGANATLSPPALAVQPPSNVPLLNAPPAAPATKAPNLPGGLTKKAGGTVPSDLRRGQPVTLNFVNADIESVARAMGVLTGRQVVVDPRVKGQINLISDKALSPARAYQQFLAALRLQGFTVVESAGLDKVVPEADAKLQSGTVHAGAAPSGAGSQVVTQIFKLNFENAANLLPVLRPLISPNNVINVNPGNNSLVITDYADNLDRIARIIAASDVANAGDVEVILLKHAVATDLVPLLARLVEGGGGASGVPVGVPGVQGDASYRTTLIAEPRSNAVLVRAANAARLNLVKSLVSRLDQPSSQGDSALGNIRVVPLKNADATKLAATLRAVLSAEVRAAQPSAASQAGTGNAGANPAALAATASTTGGQIQADVATNSLIITASDPQFRQLREVIDRLDTRRPQVFVESLIAEVNADRAAEMGIQWQGPIGRAGDSNIGLLGTNFGSGGRNIINLATGAAAGTTLPANGLNFGIATQNNGVYTLGFLARFLEQNGDGNILSTPNLLTLDNEEAKIVIGQNVPFITGQYTNANAGGTGSVNPFQTIERKDVGLTLKVKPQISEGGTVRLSIFQEVSNVASTSSTAGPITNKRSIESNVLVEDGSIVVLGGLLQDEYQGNNDRVPGLADIPLLGALFRSEARTRKKTNLMVFLRPVVVRDAAATEALANKRYEQIRGVQQESQPEPSKAMPISESPVLPAPSKAPAPLLAPSTTPPLPAGR